MPALFLNLSGEVIYILKQRLRAHNSIDPVEATSALSLICAQLLSADLMRTLLHPQPLFTPKSIKFIFSRIISQSQVTIDDKGLDRLMELASASFKYQLLNCSHSHELLLLTRNHLQNMVKICSPSDDSNPTCVMLQERLSAIDLDILTNVQFESR